MGYYCDFKWLEQIRGILSMVIRKHMKNGKKEVELMKIDLKKYKKILFFKLGAQSIF